MSMLFDYIQFMFMLPQFILSKTAGRISLFSIATVVLMFILFYFDSISGINFPGKVKEYNTLITKFMIGMLIMSMLFLVVNEAIKLGAKTRSLLDKPVRTLENDFAKPTDIVNNMREDDKNTLMFGRSSRPTDALTENSGKNEILKGYVNSSDMGEQYGTFTGMTLYGGPDMYTQDDILRVFPDYPKYKTQKKIELREASDEIREKSAAVQELLDKESLTDDEQYKLEELQEELFKALLKEENKENKELGFSEEDARNYVYQDFIVNDLTDEESQAA